MTYSMHHRIVLLPAMLAEWDRHTKMQHDKAMHSASLMCNRGLVLSI